MYSISNNVLNRSLKKLKVYQYHCILSRNFSVLSQMKHYGIKGKELYYRYKKARTLSKDYNILSRKEFIEVVNTYDELLVGLPLVLWFMIPILGYTTPLLAYYFPQALPKSFRNEKQQKK